ncbi:MAG: serine/threonine protein kinase [Chitinispirillaceae bacterium]|nr:serine/threonine protein kinase [Chitinispirillaceae bacterium]
MGSFPGYLFKKSLGRLFARKTPSNNVNQPWRIDRDAIDMSSSELETSGLQDKSTVTNFPLLPDGSTPIQLGSGLITGILGEGGAAIIYEIKNKQLGLQRAVKLLKPHFTRDSYNRFLREFRISIQLSHPNLAVVHSIGQWNKMPFIEMEKITGFSLSEIVAQFGPLPTGLVTAIGIILCKSLEYLHSCTYEIDKKMYRGLLHLDLKPSNILLSESGVLKIMDFGLSTPSEEVGSGLYPKAGVGSPQYIAPELLLGQAPPDVRSDIYSLGCILYELLSGVKTFPGPEEESVMELRSTNTYVSLKKFSKAIPPDLLHLIEECLSLKKDNRPINIESIRKDLELVHQSVTRLTPENTIQTYINQRKLNEPFSLPRPLPTAAAILRTIGLVFLLAGMVAIALVFLLQSRSGKLHLTRLAAKLPSLSEKMRADTSPGESVPKKTPPPPSNAPVASEEGDFYATERNTVQSALMDSVRLAWSSRKFDVMISLIDRLPPDLAQSKEVLLYKLRALGRGGEELGKLLKETEVLDGEYYFHKARYQFGKKDFKHALINLEKAQSLPCEFLDKRILGREVQFYKSRMLTSIFRTDPTSENLKAALDSWNRLLELVSDRPQGIHSKEAQKEKQNLLAEAQWRGIS